MSEDEKKLDNARFNLQEVKKDINTILRTINLGTIELRQGLTEKLHELVKEKDQYEKDKRMYEDKLKIKPEKKELDDLIRARDVLIDDMNNYIKLREGIKESIEIREKQIKQMGEKLTDTDKEVKKEHDARENKINDIRKLIENAFVAPLAKWWEKEGLLKKALEDDSKLQHQIEMNEDKLAECQNGREIKLKRDKIILARAEKEIGELEKKIKEKNERIKQVENLMKSVKTGGSDVYYHKYIKYKKKYMMLKKRAGKITF